MTGLTVKMLKQVLASVPDNAQVRLGSDELAVASVSLHLAVGREDRPFPVLHLDSSPVEDWPGERVLWQDPEGAQS